MVFGRLLTLILSLVGTGWVIALQCQCGKQRNLYDKCMHDFSLFSKWRKLPQWSQTPGEKGCWQMHFWAVETPGKGWVFLENASIFLFSFSRREDSYVMVNIYKLANIYVSSSGGGHSNPLQYSRLENPMDGGAWLATVAENQTWLGD